MDDNPMDMLRSCFNRYKNVEIELEYGADDESMRSSNVYPTIIYADPVLGSGDCGGVWLTVSHSLDKVDFIYTMDALAKLIPHPLRNSLTKIKMINNGVQYHFYMQANIFPNK